MDRIFNNVGGSALSRGFTMLEGEDEYDAAIKAMISDSVDFNESTLMPDREKSVRYYYGKEPDLLDNSEEAYDSFNGDPETPDLPNRSTVVSTDVRDTIMAILPSLMRIFAAGEHVVTYTATRAEHVEAAKAATNYVRHKLWQDNNGFLLFYAIFKDALTSKIGIVTWDTKTDNEVQEKEFGNVTYEELVGILEGGSGEAQLLDYTPMKPDGTYDKVRVRFVNSSPRLIVEAVPPDEFRVSRNCGMDVTQADLVGRERLVRAGELVKMGYDAELIAEFVGDSYSFYEERYYRNPGESTFAPPLGDYVRYGEYFVRIDRDGDGIEELRKVCTIGEEYRIVDDYVVDRVKYSVFGPDPRPHTLVGDSMADYSMDIQRINTNLIRGALDSLAQTINPRTGINETIVNVEDALNDDIGSVIRVKGDPMSAIQFYNMPWVGMDVFQMKDQMDRMRIARTGISEASKGLDPKALQSTAVAGVDMIANGAQERIELIARLFAETGMAPLFRGLLQEVSDWPNHEEMLEINGKMVSFNPSTFPASLKVKVNPALGRGTDMARLSALSDIAARQEQIIARFGIKNPIVTPQEYLNTVQDMLEIVNIRDFGRYFRPITEEVQQAIMGAPDEPDPTLVLAQAELEKSKTKLVETKAKLDQDEINRQRDDDFRRDELSVNAFLNLFSTIAKDGLAAGVEGPLASAEGMNLVDNNHE